MTSSVQKSEVRRNTAVSAFFCALLAAVLLCSVAIPDRDFSDVEKRKLSLFPELTLSAVTSGRFEDALEVYLQDQFPSRKAFVGIGSYFDALLQRNGVDGIYHGTDGYLFNEPVTPDDAKLSRNIALLNSFAKSFDFDAYLMTVPSAGYVMSECLPVGSRTYRDGEINERAADLADAFCSVELCSVFSQNKSASQLYYKTDHHWTSAGAYSAYIEFSKQAGFLPASRESFTVESVDNFYGTTYSKAALWFKKPDTLELWQGAIGKNVSVTVGDLDGKKKTTDDMFFREHLTQYDMYPVYLDGNHAYTVITNPDAAGGSLLMLKDSFGNSLAPFLAQSFKTVVMVDLRHYRTQPVSSLAEDYDVDTLLAVYSTDDIVNDANFTWLK